MNLPVSPSYALLEAKFYSLIQMDREMRNHLHSQKRIHKRLTNSITMIFSNLNFLFLFFLIFHLTPTFQCSNAMFFGKATVQNWCGDMYLCTDTISCSRF